MLQTRVLLQPRGKALKRRPFWPTATPTHVRTRHPQPCVLPPAPNLCPRLPTLSPSGAPRPHASRMELPVSAPGDAHPLPCSRPPPPHAPSSSAVPRVSPQGLARGQVDGARLHSSRKYIFPAAESQGIYVLRETWSAFATSNLCPSEPQRLPLKLGGGPGQKQAFLGTHAQ